MIKKERIEIAPLLNERRRRAKRIPTDGLGTESHDIYPVPKAAIIISIRDSAGDWYPILCDPLEFNPLSLAAGIAFGEIHLSNSVRADLTNECGYIFATPGAELVIN